MSHVNLETSRWLRNVLRPEYLHVDRTFDDVVETLNELRSLRPKTDIYNENGQVRLLLLLHGNVAINFEKTSYRIPLHVWLPHDYPLKPPMAFVAPVAGMGIRPGNFVDIDRRCYHPYLANWTTDPRQSRLVEALRCLQYVFSKSPPVYALSQSAPEGGSNLYGIHRPPIPAKVELVMSGQDSLNRQHGMSIGVDTARNYSLTRPVPLSNSIKMMDTSYAQHILPAARQLDLLSTDRDEAEISKKPRRPTNPRLFEVIRQIQIRLGEFSDNEHRQFLQRVKREDEVTRDLQVRSAALNTEVHSLNRLVHVAWNNAIILRDKTNQAKQLVEDTSRDGVPDIDQCLVAQNAVYNQLYDAVAQESALEDTIYALGKALENERVSMDDFLKHIKVLAREQFMQRALISKITKLLALE